MLRFKKQLLLWAALGILTLFLIPYCLLVAGATTKEFRAFSESKVSEFLKADVKIGRIRVGFFNQIILSHLQIKPGSHGTLPGVEVEQIIFRYSLTQLLMRNFKIPAAIILKSPKMGQISLTPLKLFF